MSANCFGRGPTSCTSPLPGIANRSYCWPQHSYRIAAESLSNGRQGLLTINKRFKWDCEKEILCLSTSGVELSITNVFLPCLPPTLAAVNLSMASTNFGDMCRNCAPILRGCQKRRHVPIVVKPWTCNHEIPCGEVPFSGVSKHRGHEKCPGIGCLLAHAQGANSMHWQYAPPRPQTAPKTLHCGAETGYGSQLELRLFVVRTLNKLHCKRPCCHSSGLDDGHVPLAQLFWPWWRLLQQHLETQGPWWYSLAEREERPFTNRSNRPEDDMKDELRIDSDSHAWSTWRTAQDQLWQLRQPPP